MNITAIPVVPLKLSQEAHYFAKKFAAEQATALKAKGVYLNTLAVCAVYSWVQWMEFSTEIDQGESWDPVIRRFNDVADLVLTDIGRLECRPLLPGERSIGVPLEVTEDRIGCVLVQFEEQLDRVKLLGFVPADASGNLPEKIAIEDLQSVEELTEYLEELEVKPPVPPPVPDRKIEQLRQLFERLFEEDWQPAEMVMTGGAYRSSQSEEPEGRVKQAKEIDLQADRVILVVQVTLESDEEVGIVVSVYPGGNGRHLPVGLQVITIDESGDVIIGDKAGRAADSMQLEFGVEPRERFGVRLMLGNVSITEYI